MIFIQEIWKDIDGYEGLYQVSTYGNVKRMPGKTSNGRILKPFADKNGYLCIGVSKNGVRKTFKIHRLVAMIYLPNPENLPEVNHKDENKTNNCVSNLEWCDHAYNSQYGTRGEKIAQALSKAVYSIDESGNVEHFRSLSDAQRITGIYMANILCVLRGEYSRAGGRRWYRE